MTKKRPNTWTGYTHQPSIEQGYSVRQTIATISTFTSTANTYLVYTSPLSDPVFHSQSLLFLFGFLFFPCWWIGGFYLKMEPIPCVDMEQSVIVHPSLIANGKTSSHVLQSVVIVHANKTDSIRFFYRWNRHMSFVSIGLLMIMLGLLIWYFVQ
ncbi:uncharacterized protein B0P05DRAFT_589238 [Gilbertella persicaria]|uniref:uncharacterized protein n=1 Tax=Gilbertella persicaria TaxID=101096 RepID=UPI00221EE087|nr:uncharacterized protein B0P05DRAFT_589238 [Gilbertella persicaria]KAI8069780.1 hypothetical protein B0P05DRAFT_589238 [Gilbertella persicaria]